MSSLDLENVCNRLTNVILTFLPYMLPGVLHPVIKGPPNHGYFLQPGKIYVYMSSDCYHYMYQVHRPIYSVNYINILTPHHQIFVYSLTVRINWSKSILACWLWIEFGLNRGWNSNSPNFSKFKLIQKTGEFYKYISEKRILDYCSLLINITRA